MREHGIRSKTVRRFRVTTQSGYGKAAACLLNRDFHARRPNQKWCADITYIRTRQGWLYLAVVLDLYSRRVVGWSMSRWISQELVIDALKMGAGRRKVSPGILIHSDQGRQYTSRAYQRELKRLAARCSMSRQGDCWDNAPVESFFATLKKELDWEKRCFPTRKAAQQAIFDYIEVFYNRKRRHSSIDYLSPVDYERRHRRLAA